MLETSGNYVLLAVIMRFGFHVELFLWESEISFLGRFR